MANIFPYKALYYDNETFKDLTPLVIPPYDNIPAGEEQKYLTRSPYNFAHVLLPRTVDEDYSHAAELINQWKDQHILKETSVPCYYLYQQSFEAYGQKHVRHTLMCSVELQPFSEGIVRPHENTYGQYKADRLQILRKTQCNLSHVFGMVNDEEGFLETLFEKWMFSDPFLKAKTDDGTEHVLWKVEGAKFPEVAQFFKDKPIYIVDGHHRYESALMYAKESGAYGDSKNPASQMLFAIANSYDPGLIVFPTHRAVKKGQCPNLDLGKIEQNYQLLPLNPEALMKFVEKPQATPQFGLYYKNQLFLVIPKEWQNEAATLGGSVAKLSVTWSDHKFAKTYCGIDDSNRSQKISYDKDAKALWSKRNDFDLIIFHAPPAVSDVTGVADEKRFMPQKSTYFFPKLAAGFTMRRLK
ncbi:MAG: DUF1015 family protein [Deltaproteobacteria bacterium]